MIGGKGMFLIGHNIWTKLVFSQWWLERWKDEWMHTWVAEWSRSDSTQWAIWWLAKKWNVWVLWIWAFIADGWFWAHNLTSMSLILFNSEIHTPRHSAESPRRLMDRNHANGSAPLASCWVWPMRNGSSKIFRAGGAWDAYLYSALQSPFPAGPSIRSHSSFPTSPVSGFIWPLAPQTPPGSDMVTGPSGPSLSFVDSLHSAHIVFCFFFPFYIFTGV